MWVRWLRELVEDVVLILVWILKLWVSWDLREVFEWDMIFWGCCGWNGSEVEDVDGVCLLWCKRGLVYLECCFGLGLYNVSLCFSMVEEIFICCL